jgi:ribosomal protein S18 acetylase RimI-like enzyme
MNNKMKIRKSTKKDAREIAEIFVKESAKKPYLQKWNKKTALKEITKSFKEYDMYVVLIDKEIIGFVMSHINKDNKEKAFVDELWLKNNYQGKGFGKSLMKFIEKIYKKKRVKIVQLVSNRKSGAFKFYKKLRYDESKEAVCMDKRLK